VNKQDLETSQVPAPAASLAVPAPAGTASQPAPSSDGLAKRRARTGRALLAPAVIIVGVVLLFPIVYAVVVSFTQVSITNGRIALGARTLSNYHIVFTSSRWQHDLLFTVGYAAVSVPVEVAMALGAALLLQHIRRGRGMAVAILLIPWAIITVIVAELWEYIFDPNYGALTWLFSQIAGHPVDVVASTSGAIFAIFITDCWKNVPFLALIVLAGLLMIDFDLYEAAAVDGAGRWQTLRSITLPQLRGALSLAVIFRLLAAFGLFDIPFILTGGGPSLSTESLSLLGYTVMFQDLKFGPATAISLTTGLLVLLVCVVAVRLLRSGGTNDLGI
jgi:multiple sugar transport system permease protein